MTLVLWISLGILGLYLLLVVPAGIAVLVGEWRFKRSPDRAVVLAIIEEYQRSLADDETAVIQVLKHGRREVVERAGVTYSVDITAKKLKSPGSYRISVSVGQLRLITIGHVESLEVSFSRNRLAW